MTRCEQDSGRTTTAVYAVPRLAEPLVLDGQTLGAGVSVLPEGKSWIDAFLEDRARRDMSLAEIERCQAVLEEFREFVRPRWLREVSPEDALRFMEEVAPHEVLERWFRERALDSFLSYLSLHNLIPWNPLSACRVETVELAITSDGGSV